MLPLVHRLRRAGDFQAVLRGGRRSGSRLLVVHYSDALDAPELPARIGFVVSKAVGPAVVRNRVKRRLRHQVRARLDRLHTGRLYVVRVNPAAAGASSQQLGDALDHCLETLDEHQSRDGAG